LSIFLVGSIVFIGCSVSPDDALSDGAGTESDTLIGGKQAADSDFPSTLLVYQGCTAAKVGDHQILIAAHCVHDTTNNIVNKKYQAGAAIQVTTAKKVTPENRAKVAIPLTVVNTEINPQWLTDCTSGCRVNVLGDDVPPDVAVVTVKEDTPTIPVATVDLRKVVDGDGVIIMGYGCETGVGKDYDYTNLSLKFQTTKTLEGTALEHPGSYITPADERYDKLLDSYFLTPGRNADGNQASLCPGDSGGPAYRDDGSQSLIVGVNAYYSFTEDDSGVSATNWHTRLDQDSRFQIGSWLAGLGVRVLTTEGASGSSAGN
jgi:hypothetical protein